LSSKITAKIAAAAPGSIHLCSVVLAELLYGAYRGGAAHLALNLALVEQVRLDYASLPFDDRCAEEYGRLRAQLTTWGNVIGPNDLMIASIAVANQLTLVTHNTAEFSRVAGLTIEDWQ
jgi:tRNA(fMet)-specific endonuclease VapC